MEGESIIDDEPSASSTEASVEVAEPAAPEQTGYLGGMATRQRVEKAREAKVGGERSLPIRIQGVSAELHRQAQRLRVTSARTAL